MQERGALKSFNMIEGGYLKNMRAISRGQEIIWDKKQFLLQPPLQLKLWLVPYQVRVLYTDNWKGIRRPCMVQNCEHIYTNRWRNRVSEEAKGHIFFRQISKIQQCQRR